MRTINVKFKRIAVSEETYQKLKKDKEHFQKTISGGKWSFDDTIKEYMKAIRKLKEIREEIKNKETEAS